jgi:hypothetical protein
VKHSRGGISIANDDGFNPLSFDSVSANVRPLPIELGDKSIWGH